MISMIKLVYITTGMSRLVGEGFWRFKGNNYKNVSPTNRL